MDFLMVCHQVACALSSHTPSQKVVTDFLKSQDQSLNTECYKCNTPIELRKNPSKPNNVSVSEIRFFDSE